MFHVNIAGIDVTDKIIGSSIVIRHSSDFPFFGDTEISDVTFDIVSEDSEFDPLKSSNWFSTNWNRGTGSQEDLKWNQTGLRCPVRMEWTEGSNDPIPMFTGVIVNIIPDIATESATIQCTDASYQLRETEMELTDFGIERYIQVGDPDNENVYKLPPTAVRVNPKTVKARHPNSTQTNDELTRVDELEFANRDKCTLADSDIRFIVIPNTPAIQTDRELTDTAVSVLFREPHRWVRVDAIAKEIIRSTNIKLQEDRVGNSQPDNEIEVDIPDFYFKTDNMEYASRGRVGWHVEHNTNLDIAAAAAHKWGWTGFVRDFVVDDRDTVLDTNTNTQVDNPDKGDVFFLYGHSKFPTFSSIIHYDYDKDTYKRYFYSIQGVTAQSLWRIATTDFENFYVLSTAFGDRPYEFGHNYNTQSSAGAADKPRILKWIKSTGVWSSVIDALSKNAPPQLANYVDTLNTQGGGMHNWWADTRMFFGKVGDTIGYRYQTSSAQGFARIDSNGSIYFRNVGVTPKNGLTSELCFDETGNTVYALTIDGDGRLNINGLNLSTGNFVPDLSPLIEFDPPNGPNGDYDDNLSVSDAVLYRNGTYIDIYCVIQFERSGRLPGASLVRLRKSQGQSLTWTLTSIIDYDYYVSSASGGVAAGDNVYYFEGNTELYGNRGPRSGFNTRQKCPGSVVEVSGTDPVYSGLSRVSAYASPDEGLSYDYGAHTGIIAPLRWDGERVHMITGYGDVANSQAFERDLTQVYNEQGFLIEEPQEDINNWQWLTLGQKQPLYIEKIEMQEKINAWDLLKKLSEIAQARLYYDGEKLYMKQREVFKVDGSDPKTYVLDEDLVPASKTRQERDYVSIIDADNYTVDDNVMSVSSDPTFTQIYNQIRGNINYTVRGALPELQDNRDILDENAESVKYIGPKPLELDVSLLSHHQLWWAKVIAARYIKQLSTVQYEVVLRLTWLPKTKIGDIIRIDVRSPQLQNSGYTWQTTHLNRLDAEVIEVEHTIDVEGDDAWTTKVVCRTFETLAKTMPPVAQLEAHDVVEPDAIVAYGTDKIYLLDNLNKKARRYTDINTRSTTPATEDIPIADVDVQDATLTTTHLVVLDKSGDDAQLKFYGITSRVLDTSIDTDGAINLDANRMPGEPRGDWRGIAYNPANSLIYVMNHFGAIRTYTATGGSGGVGADLDMCADYKGMTFQKDKNGLITLLTVINRLSTVLAWDLSQAGGSGAALFPQKYVEMDEIITHYTGIASFDNEPTETGEEVLLACRKNRDGFLAFPIGDYVIPVPPGVTEDYIGSGSGNYLSDGSGNYLGGT